MLDRDSCVFDSASGVAGESLAPAVGIAAREVEDHALLRRYVETGSEDAFTQIVLRHSRWIHGICRRALHDPHLAEDATQAVFLLLSRKAPGFSPETPLGPWLYQSCRFVLQDLRKNRARYQRRQEIARATALRQMIEAGNGPEEPPAELLAALDEAIGGLNERDRAVVLMHFYEGLTLRQMAQRLELTRDGAKKRVSRVLARLRNALASQGFLKRAAPLTILAVLLRTQSAEAIPPHLPPLLVQAATVPGAASMAAQSIAGAVAATLTRGTTRLLLALAITATPVVMLATAFKMLQPPASTPAPPVAAAVQSTGDETAAPWAELSALAARPAARPRGAELIDQMPESTGGETQEKRPTIADLASTLERHRQESAPVAAPTKAAVVPEEVAKAPAGSAAAGGGSSAGGGIAPVIVYAPSARPHQAPAPFHAQTTVRVVKRAAAAQEAPAIEKPVPVGEPVANRNPAAPNQPGAQPEPIAAHEPERRPPTATPGMPKPPPGMEPPTRGTFVLFGVLQMNGPHKVIGLNASFRAFELDWGGAPPEQVVAFSAGTPLIDGVAFKLHERPLLTQACPDGTSLLAIPAHPRDLMDHLELGLPELREAVHGDHPPIAMYMPDERWQSGMWRHPAEHYSPTADAAQAPEPTALLPVLGVVALLRRRGRRSK